MTQILISCLIISVVILSYGVIISKYVLNEKIDENLNFYESSIFGIIFLSFSGVILNFVVPLNIFVGNTVLFFGLILFLILFFKFKLKKNISICVACISLLCFFIITLSKVNQPDAGLYHLPYTRLLNENKIIFGASNIHFRFGHISIIQYLSALFNNSFFPASFITLPLAALVSIFICYLIHKFYYFIKENNFLAFIIFLVLIFSLYNFNRYGSYGNDAPSHIYFFLLAIVFLEAKNIINIDTKTFYKITFITLYLFSLKVFMSAALIIPLVLFLISKYKLKILKNIKFILSLLFFLTWIIKSIIITGCLIYPIENTCFKKLDYYDLKTTKETIFVSEAWAKGWVDQDQKQKVLKYQEYIKDFNWIETWKNKHLKKIYEKVVPFIVFLIIIFIFMLINQFLKKNEKLFLNINTKRLLALLIISIFFVILWFLKFPIYRYGSSFIILSMILIYALLFRGLINNLRKKFYTFIIILGVTGFIFKNSIKIYDNYNILYNDYPWPRIYSFNIEENNLEKIFQKINHNNNLVYYYSNQELCMYSMSPCSNYLLKNLRKKKLFNYDYYFLKN